MTLNIPHLQQVLDWLESDDPAHTLDMGLHYCGTACCISGYTAVDLAGHKNNYLLDHDKIAADYLGLPQLADPDDECQPLFYPDTAQDGWEDITPAQAAQAVRNVMAGKPPGWAEILT